MDYDLEEMLKKASELQVKEEVSKQRDRDEKMFNMKKDYEEAIDRFNKKIEDPNVGNVLRIFKKIGTLPKGYERIDDSTFPLYLLVCSYNQRDQSNKTDSKIAFTVDEWFNTEKATISYTNRWRDEHNFLHGWSIDLTIDQEDKIKKEFIYYDYSRVNGRSSWINDYVPDKLMEKKTVTMNKFCERIDKFVEQASACLSHYLYNKELLYGNVNVDAKINLDLKRNMKKVQNKLSEYNCYCVTNSKTYYFSNDGQTLLSVDNALSDMEKVVLIENAEKYNIDDEEAKVYIFATDNQNRDRLEDLWQEYVDDEDSFEYVSEEFEDGVEQYKEEIGIDIDDGLEL